MAEEKYGVCGEKGCDGVLIGSTLEVKGTNYRGHYCPKCHHITPPPPGNWSPVNPKVGEYTESMSQEEEMRRLRKR